MKRPFPPMIVPVEPRRPGLRIERNATGTFDTWIGPNGEVALADEYMDKLNIHVGDWVKVTAEKGRIRIEPVVVLSREEHARLLSRTASRRTKPIRRGGASAGAAEIGERSQPRKKSEPSAKRSKTKKRRRVPVPKKPRAGGAPKRKKRS